MRKVILFIIVACCAAAIGCSKDREVNAFVSEFESVTKNMTAKLEQGDIEGAGKVFTDKKDSLKSSFDAFKNAREMQVSAETKKALENSVMENVKTLTSAGTRAAIKSGDKAKADEIQALLKDFVSIFQM